MATTVVNTADWRRPPERGDAVNATDDSVADLLAKASHGDQRAWNAIVDRYTNLLWSVGRAHRLETADIGDVVQTTWLRLLENLDRIRDPERLAGWLATTARRECLRVLRRSGRESVGWDDESAPHLGERPSVPIDQLLLVEERDAQLWQCFLRLSARCQQLLRVLMAAEPASYAEIAQAWDMPVGSIGPTRMRCLQRLREITRETGYPFDPAPEWS
jgi:RNA polymerase sigma factor (sigma-70 family)